MGDSTSVTPSVRPQVSSLQLHNKLELIITLYIAGHSYYAEGSFTYSNSRHVSARSHHLQLKYNLSKCNMTTIPNWDSINTVD